jgi:hypothetical protein
VFNVFAADSELEYGYINLYLDVLENRPVDFNDYSYSVTIYPQYGNITEGNIWSTSYLLTADNGYKLRIKAPLGTYSVLSVNAIGDKTGKFGVTSPTEITINKDNPEFTYKFEFLNKDLITNTERESETIEPTPIKEQTKDHSQIILIAGIIMIFVAVIIGICIFLMASNKKYKN